MDIKWFVYHFEYKQYFIFEIAQQEIQTYRDMPKHSKFSTPFLFYEMNRDKFPNLSVLATKYLVIQATSVASERVFSTSGDIESAERSCIDPDSLDAMVFLKKNFNSPNFVC